MPKIDNKKSLGHIDSMIPSAKNNFMMTSLFPESAKTLAKLSTNATAYMPSEKIVMSKIPSDTRNKSLVNGGVPRLDLKLNSRNDSSLLIQ